MTLRPDVGVLVRMRRVGVEEAAAVGAELLDGELTGDRTLRDRLLGAFERRRIDVLAEVLRHAERDKRECRDDRQRQQHVKRDPRQVDPEVADRRRLGAAEGTRQRHDDRHAGCRRDEVLHGEADHLAEVGQRRLAAVALPVGVGDERRRRVEGEMLAHPCEALRVERQVALQPQDRIQQHEAGGVEHQQGRDVLEPRLLARLVDPSQRIEPPLDGAHRRGKEGPPAFQHRSHEGAQRSRRGDDENQHEGDLQPSVERHGSVQLVGARRARLSIKASRDREARRRGSPR